MTMRLENHNPAVKAEKLDKLNQLLQSGITSPSELMKETGLSKQTINTKKKAFAAGEEITPPAKVKEKEVKPKEDMDNHLAAVISAIKAHDKEITRQICFALMDFTPEVACYIPLVERALDESL
jgi:hypothetical protein